MGKETFAKSWLTKLWRPSDADNKFGAGQVMIVGGSSLFHGAPILALKAASRLVSMVYFATPEADHTIAEKLKAGLGSFIWVPFDQLSDYVAKSDAVLIGPGMMRNRVEGEGLVIDEAGKESRQVTLAVVTKYPAQKYVIDGGALQVMAANELPRGAIITPNRKEFAMLFGEELSAGKEVEQLSRAAKKYRVVIAHKAPTSIVTDGERVVSIEGGNPGLVKGGVGDVVAGLAVGLAAKNEAILAAASAIYLTKRAADRLDDRVGFMYNADDLADEVGRVYREEV
ncbi:MAG: NAD(P)H-hydrate dehydratase [Patescibacteria group bacterium]